MCQQIVHVDGPRQFIKDGKNGLLVPVGNSDMIAEAICRIIENPKEADDFSNNANNSKQKYSIENIVEQWQEIIKLVLRG